MSKIARMGPASIHGGRMGWDLLDEKGIMIFHDLAWEAIRGRCPV